VLSSTLEIDTAAVIVDAATGQVRYDFAAGDVDTEGLYVAWWRATETAGPNRIQDTPEFLLWIREHDAEGDASQLEYVSMEDLKSSLSLSGKQHADLDFAGAVVAASRIVDQLTGTTFTATAPGVVRYYTPVSSDYVLIDPNVTLTAVTVQGEAFVLDTDYYREGNTVLRRLARKFPRNVALGVAVTGTWGYAAVPEEVRQATKIIAAQIVQRVRQAPFGILSTTIDGPAIRLGQYDPQVDALLSPYSVSQMIE